MEKWSLSSAGHTTQVIGIKQSLEAEIWLRPFFVIESFQLYSAASSAPKSCALSPQQKLPLQLEQGLCDNVCTTLSTSVLVSFCSVTGHHPEAALKVRLFSTFCFNSTEFGQKVQNKSSLFLENILVILNQWFCNSRPSLNDCFDDLSVRIVFGTMW